jgi:acetyl-CoA carboxylase biotin carboxyl carrier protein
VGVKETAQFEARTLDIDLNTIRELLAVVSNTDITELTIESGDQRITVKKSSLGGTSMQATLFESGPHAADPPPRASASATQAAAVKVEPATQKKVDPQDNGASNGYVQITSPMVGTFYRAPSPSAPPFVSVGDRVTVGQTVCIIEAMKLMNDMPSEVAGKIVKVLVDSGTTVEYGQALFMVDPKG